MFKQVITPNPNTAAEEGMCLQYVRMTYGLPIRYGSATEAWEKSTSQHRDRNFPAGVAHPVWYGLASNVNGHVVLRMADGTVWSTSDRDPSPLHHHASLADLEAYYAYYGVPLTYRGWTEDVAGFPVIAPIISTPPVKKEWDELATPQQIHEAVWGPAESAAVPAPFIWNNKLGRKEYPRTVLGALQDRIVTEQIAPLRQAVAAQDAQIKSLVGAVAAMAKGEPFDQAKLLAGVQSAAAQGVAQAIKSIDTTVTVKAV